MFVRIPAEPVLWIVRVRAITTAVPRDPSGARVKITGWPEPLASKPSDEPAAGGYAAKRRVVADEVRVIREDNLGSHAVCVHVAQPTVGVAQPWMAARLQRGM